MTKIEARRAAAPGYEQANAAARYIRGRTSLRPEVGVVLGSGLGGATADRLEGAKRIEYRSIPHFPAVTAPGHAGRLWIGRLGGVPTATLQGRLHLYEGYTAQQVVFPVRVLAHLGVRALVVTNAAGAVSPDYPPGSFVLLRDHINLMGSNPLTGPNEGRWGLRFPDMTQAYWAPYREMARGEGRRLGRELPEGVYAAVSGPSYETPAEVRYLRTIGADLVGMSTVPEVIAAAHLGLRVLGISCVTNVAAGGRGGAATAEEVLRTAEEMSAWLAELLLAVVPRIAEDLGKSG